jgi:hypothetical protein
MRNPGFRLRPSRSKPGARSKVGKFKVIDNKPKSERAKGAVSLPEAAELETAKDRATIQGNESAMVRGKPRTEGSLII